MYCCVLLYMLCHFKYIYCAILLFAYINRRKQSMFTHPPTHTFLICFVYYSYKIKQYNVNLSVIVFLYKVHYIRHLINLADAIYTSRLCDIFVFSLRFFPPFSLEYENFGKNGIYFLFKVFKIF